MDPIKINVEVNLGEATLAVLKTIFNTPLTLAANQGATTKVEKPQPAPEPQPKPVMGADPIGTGAEDDDDLPPNDAPAPQMTTPSEDDARNAVKAARGRGVPAKTIKDYMQKEFNIASSIECPAERRQALIDGLNKLAA